MTMVDVLVVGAGFAGIAAARALIADGTDVLVIERAAEPGGTWRDNTYPGVACDVPSHLYRLADVPNPSWSRVFAPGDEILAYLHGAASGLPIRYSAPMLSAQHTDDGWIVRAGDDWITARAIVIACGRLTEPRIPDVPGLDTFDGPIFHSAHWDHGVQLEGRRVAVVGTGASAVQLTPAIVERGATVTLFQRTPAWIVPRDDRAYTAAELDAFGVDPQHVEDTRAAWYDEGEERYASRSGDAAATDAARDAALQHLAAQVTDARLRADLTPDYAFGCKRVLRSDDFYPAVAGGGVTLEPSALSSVDDGVLVADSGARHEVDVIVLATGFQSTRQPYAELITGADGETLAEHWSRGMTSVASTLVAGFTDLYVMNGPNASLGHNSAVLMMEAQADLIVRLIHDGGVQVTAQDEADYAAEIDAMSVGTPWLSGCENWYVDDRSGRLALLWPGTVAAFRERLARVPSMTPQHRLEGTR